MMASAVRAVRGPAKQIHEMSIADTISAFSHTKRGTGDSFGSKGGGKCKGQKPESLF